MLGRGPYARQHTRTHTLFDVTGRTILMVFPTPQIFTERFVWFFRMVIDLIVAPELGSAAAEELWGHSYLRVICLNNQLG